VKGISVIRRGIGERLTIAVIINIAIVLKESGNYYRQRPYVKTDAAL
jgi:hypothetical protein